MKVEDFAFRVAMRTIDLMEELQHYKVSDETKKEIGSRIGKEVNELLKGAR